MTVGYPFARVAIDGDALKVSCPWRSGRFIVPIDAVVRAERTRHGVRIWTEDPTRRFLLMAPRVVPLVEMLNSAGIEIDGKITKSSWSGV